MNSYHNLNAINSVQAEKLTNTTLKYIKESTFRILLRDFETMFLGALRDTFRPRAVSAALAAGLLLASFGNAAMAQQGNQLANAPANQPTVTQPSGKQVLLRVGPGFSMSEANLAARFLIDRGCPTTVTTERGFPRHLTVEVDGQGSKFTKSGSAGAAALHRCLDNS
ncbi:MAG: hypothetical protein HQ481_16105 [Alphaproteobacteria bacterium]|nr:hypothetical protein [Alphaproteobacteria bacterium]